jgi:hypothetical protein
MYKRLIMITFVMLFVLNSGITFAFWASQVFQSETQGVATLSIGTWTIPNIYDFSEITLDDFIDEGAWIVSGSLNDPGSSLQSSGGLLYMPNPLTSYTINLQTQILSSGTGGGYGILFDTTVNNPSKESDTGWALQFDRGYSGGEIIIRPRVNGGERNPVFRYEVRFDQQGQLTTQGGLKNNSNPWWTAEHTLRLEVSVLNAQLKQKRLTLYVDDQFLFTFDFTSPIFDPVSVQNVTGLRTWSGVNVAFYELVIIEQD